MFWHWEWRLLYRRSGPGRRRARRCPAQIRPGCPPMPRQGMARARRSAKPLLALMPCIRRLPRRKLSARRRLAASRRCCGRGFAAPLCDGRHPVTALSHETARADRNHAFGHGFACDLRGFFGRPSCTRRVRWCMKASGVRATSRLDRKIDTHFRHEGR